MVIEQHTKAFTLIELVVSITLAAILFSSTAIFMSHPIRAYADISKRAQLLDIAELALRRMERDIRQAVPNSLRVKSSAVNAIEIVNVVEGLRYRGQGPANPVDILDFSTTNTSFNVLGQFQSAQLGSSGNYRIAIYNTGAQGAGPDDPISGANIYATLGSPGPELPIGSHVITPASTIITLSNPGPEGRVELSSAFQFSLASPKQRLYIIDTPVSYICDLSKNTIVRYSGYAISDVQPIDPILPPLNSAQSALLADHVTACSFSYQAGTAQKNGLITIELTIADGAENIRLLQQVGVNNAP